MASPLPSSMKAQVLESFNQPYTLKSYPTPQIEQSLDIIVKVEAASFCHTDELLRTGEKHNLPSLPFIGCHEFAGTVVAIGSSVQNVRIGDHVGCLCRGFRPCGTCYECSNPQEFDGPPGQSAYCATRIDDLGLTVNGGFAEYALVDSRQVAVIPEGMTSLETAPLMCAGVTMFHALLKCKVPKGGSVGIIGAGGGLGHLGVQFAVKMGYVTVAVDAADGPLALAADLGTSATLVDARITEANQVISNLLSEGKLPPENPGLDAVIILPESQASYDYGMALLRKRGICNFVSFPKTFAISPGEIIRRDLKIIGTSIGSAKTLREMVQFAATNGVKAKLRVYSFRDLNQLVEDSHSSQGGKYVIDMSKE